jgi:hypothetical protein
MFSKAFLKIYFQSRLKACYNYLVRYLDWITRIEVVIFVVLLFGYIFLSLNQQAHRIVEKNGLLAWQQAFADYFTTFLVIVLIAGFITARREIRNEHISLLIPQSLSLHSIALARIADLLGYLFIVLPLWIGFFLVFIHQQHQAWFIYLFAFFAFTLCIAAASLIAIACAAILNEKKDIPLRFLRTCCMAVVAGLYLLFVLALYKNGVSNLYNYGPIILINCFFCLSGTSLYLWSLTSQILYSPENLYLLPQHGRTLLHAWLLPIFLLWVPKRIKALVSKDLIFASRYYKTHYVMFALFVIVVVMQILKSAHINDAIQWLISLSILASYLYANFGFKFSQEEVEDLRLPRFLPVSSCQYWWAKFWINFLPVLWIILIGHTTVLMFFSCDITSFIKSFFPSLGIAFTLLFIQNNFALYSYPYSRYSVLWYNLYIILAVTFFTIFLFPPLAVVFLVVGYVGIFRVLRRYEVIEVSE